MTLPFSASTDSAPAAMAAANTRSAMNKASSAIAVEAWVPLISARPSLGPSSSGSHAEPVERFAGGEDVAFEVDRSVAHQRGDEVGERGEVARRADAALAGMSGMASWSSSACSASITSGRTPE